MDNTPVDDSRQENRVKPTTEACNTSQGKVTEVAEKDDGSWSTVVKRGKKNKGRSGPNQPVAKTTTKRPPKAKLAKQPRTNAVMVTLTPEAIGKGVSYAQILERAQQSIHLVQLGISEGLTVRQAISGARLLELSSA